MKLKQSIWITALAAGLIIPSGTASAQETATPVGSDSCVACHSEQAKSFNSSMHGKKIPLVRKMAADKTCEACHGAGSLHAAAAGDKTNPGFGTIKNPAKTDSKEVAKVCFTCHKQKEIMLWSTSSHAQASVTCNKCHSVHNGKGLNQLKKSANETCYECHKKQKADGRLPSHHPVAEGKMECVSCHNPHGGPMGNLKAETVNETCFKCHAEKGGPFSHEHSPVAENCSICHKPHGSVNDNLLKSPLPYMCLNCHKSDHSIATGGAVTGARVQQYGSRCTDCHRDIHGSDIRASFKY